MYHHITKYNYANMCKIVCELCVTCDYDSGFTSPCSKFDPHLESKESVTEHMNETKETSTNQIMFLLCRMCAYRTDPSHMDKLDSIHAEFISDMIESVSKENHAKTIMITDKNGRIVNIME